MTARTDQAFRRQHSSGGSRAGSPDDWQSGAAASSSSSASASPPAHHRQPLGDEVRVPSSPVPMATSMNPPSSPGTKMRHRSYQQRGFRYSQQDSSQSGGGSNRSLMQHAPPAPKMLRGPSTSLDDADVAAGSQPEGDFAVSSSSSLSRLQQPPLLHQQHQPPSPLHPLRSQKLGALAGSETDFLLLSSSASAAGAMSGSESGSDVDADDHLASSLEFATTHRVLVLGVDISHLNRRAQFVVCASGVICFSLLYGYLQELISVQLCNRKLGLFIAMAQFSGYTAWSYVFRNYVRRKTDRRSGGFSSQRSKPGADSSATVNRVPFEMFLGLSLLRAVDLAMTNMAMQYVNYPAKTLMKSSRVVFTMIFGVLVARKRYRLLDFAIVGLMVAGLAIFMHADANSSAVFQPLGIGMLTISLLCDGAISNMSEAIMNQFGVGQDEFIFRLYSIALVAIVAAAAVRGDLVDGMRYLVMPGTLDEIESGSAATWSASAKVMVMIIFSTTGFFGASCSSAITKEFGALTMSITSTARKAMTLFLSFALFPNECTLEHVAGILLFICSLVAKSLRASRGSGGGHRKRKHSMKDGQTAIELGGTGPGRLGMNGSGHARENSHTEHNHVV